MQQLLWVWSSLHWSNRIFWLISGTGSTISISVLIIWTSLLWWLHTAETWDSTSNSRIPVYSPPNPDIQDSWDWIPSWHHEEGGWLLPMETSHPLPESTQEASFAGFFIIGFSYLANRPGVHSPSHVMDTIVIRAHVCFAGPPSSSASFPSHPASVLVSVLSVLPLMLGHSFPAFSFHLHPWSASAPVSVLSVHIPTPPFLFPSPAFYPDNFCLLRPFIHPLFFLPSC